MLEVNVEKIKIRIDKMGLKQKYISEQMGMTESKLSLSLSGKRKFEAGEYANLCKIIGVPMNEFLDIEADKKGA